MLESTRLRSIKSSALQEASADTFAIRKYPGKPVLAASRHSADAFAGHDAGDSCKSKQYWIELSQNNIQCGPNISGTSYRCNGNALYNCETTEDKPSENQGAGMKPIRTYILVADGARSHLLLSEGRGKPLTEVKGSEHKIVLKPDHELSAERPGRVHESANVSRHAIERADLHQREKERFAQSLAADLDLRLANGEYDRLVVAAAPETLGVIRSSLSAKVKSTILAEVAKDLTKLPNPEIKAHLGNDLPI
jgi:protein required for attachment to host cells